MLRRQSGPFPAFPWPIGLEAITPGGGRRGATALGALCVANLKDDEPVYSSRNAICGSTRAARRAGAELAMTPTANSPRATLVKTTGS